MKKIIVLFSVFTFFFNAAFAYELTREEKEQTYNELELLADCLSIVQSRYVDSTAPKDLVYGALSGMLEALDPHSLFLTPEDYTDLLEDTSGKFGGLGIEIAMRDGVLTVITPLEDTPAWSAGIQPNDKIVEIEGGLTKDMSLSEAVKLLRGDPGTEVRITILREKEAKIFEQSLVRAVIRVKVVRKAVMLDDGIGYVRISDFGEETGPELGKALRKLHSQGLKGLILDLRSNPGGLMTSAVDVASYFLGPKKLVVYTLDRDKAREEYFTHSTNITLTDMPLVVLVNDGSASASEIVAGCMQDHKRGLVVGVNTYGKASVQSLIPLAGEAALKLTTAIYYPPNGRLVNGKGIKPDIEVQQKVFAEEEPDEKSAEEVFDKVRQMEKHEQDQENASAVPDKGEDDKDFYKSDYQIIRALDLIRGLVILNK